MTGDREMKIKSLMLPLAQNGKDHDNASRCRLSSSTRTLLIVTVSHLLKISFFHTHSSAAIKEKLLSTKSKSTSGLSAELVIDILIR